MAALAVQERSVPPPGGARSLPARAPFWSAALICLALAALSAAVLPTVPSYDPWSWIVWGREVTDPHLSFTVAGGPSWKPLPVIFTAVYGLFGGASPTLWVITARAGGLMAFVAAYRLGARLLRDSVPEAAQAHRAPAGAGHGLGRWAALAGVLAAVGVALTQEFGYYMFRGTSEPMLIGVSLWAIDRHLLGRYRSAFLLGVAASLIRPEAWPFVGLYAIWLWRRDSRFRALLVLGLLSIPFFWFVPPWIGTGQPFIAASHAKDYNGHLGSDPFLEVLRRGADLQIVPSFVFGIIAVLLAFLARPRRRLVLGLGMAAAAWWVLVVAMTLDGYPGLERFYLPAAGVLCVLGGVGLVWCARGISGWLARRARSGGGLGRALSAGGAGAAVLAALLILISVPLGISRAARLRDDEPIASSAVTRLDQLSAAVAAVGGHDGVYPCHSSFAAVNHGVQTALAWKLHVTLERVGTAMRYPGVWFVGPHDSIDGGPAPLNPYFNRVQFVKQVGVWKIYRVYRFGHPMGCIGG